MAYFAKSLIRDSFKMWDVDGNGTIEKEELAAVLGLLGDFKPDDIEKVMIEADTNFDGMIQYDEFVNWLMRPVVTVGAAALLSSSDLCLRADNASIGSPTSDTDEEEPVRWVFGDGVRPVRFEHDLPLRREHTLVVWAQLGDEAPCTDLAPLVGDSRPNWGISFGLSRDGRLGLLDPRAEQPEAALQLADEPTGIKPGEWAMYVFRGMCCSPKSSAKGKTEFLVASDKTCLRMLGTVDTVGSGLVVSEFGSSDKGLSAIASVALWPRLLADEELKELFIWDAVRLGCVDEAEGAWLKLNRRRPPARSEEEESTLSSRLEAAACGKSGGSLDLQGLKVVDADLPRVVSAVESGFTTVSALSLSDNFISEDGVKDHLVPFLWRLTEHFRLDLHLNKDINRDAEQPLLEAVASLPPELGVTVDARGTGLGAGAAQKLLHPSPQAADAVMQALKENARTEAMQATFDAEQPALQQKWEQQTDGPVDLPVEGALSLVESATLFDEAGTASPATVEVNALLLRNGGKDFSRGVPLKEALVVPGPAMKSATRLVLQKGPDKVEISDLASTVCDASALFVRDTFADDFKALLDKAPFEKFPDGTKTATEDLKLMRAYLAQVARAMYDHKDGPKFPWSRQGGAGLPHCCGTGQLLAHFSYLSFSVRLRPHQDFGLRLREQGEQASTKYLRAGAVGLHSAVEDGKLSVEAVAGKSYGHNALTIKFGNQTQEPLLVAVQAGSVFQHKSWIHRQNLVVGRTVHVELPPGQSQEHKVGAYCMNRSCSCSDDDPMDLTALILEDTNLLQSQGKIWDNFEGLFSKYRAEAGFPDGAKKKKKGKKK